MSVLVLITVSDYLLNFAMAAAMLMTLREDFRLAVVLKLWTASVVIGLNVMHGLDGYHLSWPLVLFWIVMLYCILEYY